MDTTFITIHDLSSECLLLYASNSVYDILGFYPEEVINRSTWGFFHPDEIPFAQEVYGRGISLDKAAVLNYARLRSKDGRWVGCECVFSIVNDVLVGCVSRYTGGAKSQKRAMDAPIIRQLFSSSPKDPRYHMLSYISNKFTQASDPHAREPRAALFLNRFTRTLPIMFASNGLQNVLGISSDQLHNKSFYYCIQENCLSEAIRCLESAKANDSIAYLRFWFRNPVGDGPWDPRGRRRRLQSSASDTQDDEEGGVPLQGHVEADQGEFVAANSSGYNSSGNESTRNNVHQYSSDSSTTINSRPSEVFDHSTERMSSTSTTPFNENAGLSGVPSRAIELEAVVSCTSDGLVVIMRQARPFALDAIRQRPVHYKNGLYASPWASEPILPASRQDATENMNRNYTPSGAPIYERITLNGHAQASAETAGEPLTQQPAAEAMGPHLEDFMQSIREVAVFAWALTGLNGCLEQYSRGEPASGATPASMPVWDGHASGFQTPDLVMS